MKNKCFARGLVCPEPVPGAREERNHFSQYSQAKTKTPPPRGEFETGQVDRLLIFLPDISKFAALGIAHGRFGGTDNLHVAQILAGKIGAGVGVNPLPGWHIIRGLFGFEADFDLIGRGLDGLEAQHAGRFLDHRPERQRQDGDDQPIRSHEP